MYSINADKIYKLFVGEYLDAKQNEPLSAHTTFRIGGPAAVYCCPQTVAELVRTLEICDSEGARIYLLGNGSNTLFADSGFPGVVVDLTKMKSEPTFTVDGDSTLMCVSAGNMLTSVCLCAQKKGLSGLEFAYGIPGTLGGAVYMNAGAYGGEIKDCLVRVSYLDEKRRLCTKEADELALGYRTSIFEREPWCIAEAVFRLRESDSDEIMAKMQELMQRRKDKQPLDMPSAGSTFKRPEGAFAGKLIEDCGLRGFTVGGAQISTKHCGFVVNCGNATCADVVELTDKVNKIVSEKTGYTLEREIRVVE